MSEETKTKNVILVAPLLTQSGYGVHSRQVARWLFNFAEQNEGINIYLKPVPWGITPWVVNPKAEDGLIAKILQHSIPVPDDVMCDLSIQLQLPNEWNPFLAEYNIGLTAGVETDKCNPEWIDAINQMDLIITPSEFTKNCFENTGEVTAEVTVIPEAFPDVILNLNDDDHLDLKLETDFNFLVFGQFTGNNPENDRKNLPYTIKWLAETFKDNSEVGIVIKTNLGRATTADRLKVSHTLSQFLTEVYKGPGPRFYLLHGDMTTKEVAKLYRHPKIKALVSFTRGEGFGLPLLEAAASDLPVITTNWSAHTEFMNKGKFVKIDYDLIPIHETRVDGKIFVDGSRWANAKEEDAKRKLRKFHSSSAIPTNWAKELGEKLRSEYSFDAISKKYDEVIGKQLL